MLMLKPDTGSQSSLKLPASAFAFTKMHGLGNDFVVLPEALIKRALASIGFNDLSSVKEKLAQIICDRHFGIGADGLILLRESSDPACELAWTYINSDGSHAQICGNGLRCLALWAFENGFVNQRTFSILTEKGPVSVEYGGPDSIQTDLGLAILEPSLIPVRESVQKEVISKELCLSQGTVNVTCVGMGNPHCVIFDYPFEADKLAVVAAEIQQNSYFPEGVNVEFVNVKSNTYAEVIVYERGCGLTLACASGAAAVLVAGVLEKRLAQEATIKLLGGELLVSWSATDEHVRISGPARVSYSGIFDLAPYKKELAS